MSSDTREALHSLRGLFSESFEVWAMLASLTAGLVCVCIAYPPTLLGLACLGIAWVTASRERRRWHRSRRAG